MAQDGVGEPSRKVHPFFSKPSPDVSSAAPTESPSTQTEDNDTAPGSDTDDSRIKRRKTNKSLLHDDSEAKKPKQRGQASQSTNDSILRLFQSAGTPAPTPTFKPAALNENTDTCPSAISDAPVPVPTQIVAELKPAIPSNETPPAVARPAASMTKVLRFNAQTGTLGSPPKPKCSKQPTRVVCIKYGRDEETRTRIAGKIARILDGTLQIPETAATTQPIKLKAQKQAPAASSTKSTHPFFSGKPKPTAEQTKAPKERNSIFLSSPISPRKQRNPFQSTKAPQFSIKSSGTKVPGAMHPLWPPHGFSHVRGLETRTIPPRCPLEEQPAKKSKGQTVNITTAESVLAQITRGVDIETIKHSLRRSNDIFHPPPAELRLPKRHFESGRKLSRRIRRELRSALPRGLSPGDDSSEDELAQERPKRPHPAIASHWHSLLSSLSAFDRSTCETSSWATKYAPTSAEQVLQPGREVILLKQWLVQLRVQSVETAGGDGPDKSKGAADTVNMKKKKRKSKLDDFVVDTEDENSEMGELSDSSDVSAAPGQKAKKRSIVKTRDLVGKDPSRIANSIIISGPHGCGKTASVYAVAKELGFEIFEINPSSRRSGKDILEKVGDMTKNHLVQRHRAEAGTSDVDETLDDIQSGKQGMMTSFFQPKPGKKLGAKAQQESAPKSSPQKAQKQSLILVEEADILYEDDKQFWATLVGMMSQSKRPFIMTCNDESLLPVQTLNLHGIFRFSPAPELLAVDLCLVVAANEGHALKRNAVEALYRSRGCDLRAALTDLNYWCQLGVGDRQGGYDWFYLRWPKGIDLDAHGDTVRVVSEDSYQPGMGWACRDPFVSSSDGLEMEGEAAEQAWRYWGVDLADWQRSFDIAPWCKSISSEATSRQHNLELLSAYDSYSSSTSGADICASGAFAEGMAEVMDATLPEMPEASQDDFIIGRSLLEAVPAVTHFCSKKPISLSIMSLARDGLKKTANADTLPPKALQPVDESKLTAILDVSFKYQPIQLTRYDVAVAFDPIAVSPKAIPSSYLDPSVFDRTMSLIVLEVAPWVRGIVGFESRLMQDRQKLSNLLSEGGKRKRMRTTRSAYSALEGGERRSTRKDRYFGDCLSTDAVMYTAGQGWQDCLPLPERQAEADDGISSSPMSVDSGT